MPARRSLGHALLSALVAVAPSVACGPSMAELRDRDERIEQSEAELIQERERTAELQGALETVRASNRALTEILDALGGDVEQLERDRQSTRARLEEAQRAIDALEEARRHDEGALQLSDEERRAMAARLEEARRALEEICARERLARARLETFRSLLRQFQSMIEGGQLRVRIVRNRMVVELPEAVLFDSGRAELKPAGREVLERVGTVLSSIDNRDFQVAGHTDDVPIRTARYPSNWELSTARAVKVARLLITAA